MHPDDEKKERAWQSTERAKRRAELRAAALSEYLGLVCLDGEHLLKRASTQDVTSHGHAVRTTLIVRALVTARFTLPEIAAAWGTTVAELQRVHDRKLIDETGIADAIEQKLVTEYPNVTAPARTATAVSA